MTEAADSLDFPSATRLSPAALSITDAARLLSKVASGQPVTIEQIEQDVLSGAPTNADGTLNLVHYAAWLVKARSHAD